MDIITIGDVHGYTKTYQKWLRRNVADGQWAVQLGDLGLGFKGVGLHPGPERHRFIRGNHDRPDKCQAHKNYLGEFGRLCDDNRMEELHSGNGFTAEERNDAAKVYFISGAFSIDRDQRTIGVDWWADEELSYEQLGKAIDEYARVKPDYVLSHECPSKAGKTLLYYAAQGRDKGYFMAKLQCTGSRTAEAMQQMLEIHQPKEWVFGHYHFPKSFHAPGFETKFTCVGAMMEPGDPPQTYRLEIK